MSDEFITKSQFTDILQSFAANIQEGFSKLSANVSNQQQLNNDLVKNLNEKFTQFASEAEKTILRQIAEKCNQEDIKKNVNSEYQPFNSGGSLYGNQTKEKKEENLNKEEAYSKYEDKEESEYTDDSDSDDSVNEPSRTFFTKSAEANNGASVAEQERTLIRSTIEQWKLHNKNYVHSNINSFKNAHINRKNNNRKYIQWNENLLELSDLSRYAYLKLYLAVRNKIPVKYFEEKKGKKKIEKYVENSEDFLTYINPYFCTISTEGGVDIPVYHYENYSLTTKKVNSNDEKWTVFLLFVTTMLASTSIDSLKNILSHAEDRKLQFVAIDVSSLQDTLYEFKTIEKRNNLSNVYFSTSSIRERFLNGNQKFLKNYLKDKGDVDAVEMSEYIRGEAANDIKIPKDFDVKNKGNSIAAGSIDIDANPRIKKAGQASVYFGSIIKQQVYTVSYPDGFLEDKAENKILQFMIVNIRRALWRDYLPIVAHRVFQYQKDTYIVVRVRFTYEAKNTTGEIKLCIFKGYLADFDTNTFLRYSAKEIAEHNGSDVKAVNPILDETYFEIIEVDLVYEGGGKKNYINRMNMLLQFVTENEKNLNNEKIYNGIPGFKLVDYPSKNEGCFSKILIEYLKKISKDGLLSKKVYNDIVGGDRSTYISVQKKFFELNEKVSTDNAKKVCESLKIPIRVFGTEGTVLVESTEEFKYPMLNVMLVANHYLYVQDYDEVKFNKFVKDSANVDDEEEEDEDEGGVLKTNFVNTALVPYDLETISDRHIGEVSPYAIGYQIVYPELLGTKVESSFPKIKDPHTFFTETPSNTQCFGDMIKSLKDLINHKDYHAFVENEIRNFNDYNKYNKVLKGTKKQTFKEFEKVEDIDLSFDNIKGQAMQETRTYIINFVMIAYNGASFDHNMLFRFAIDNELNIVRSPGANGKLMNLVISFPKIITKNGTRIHAKMTVWDPLLFIGGSMSLNDAAKNFGLLIGKDDLDHDIIQKAYDDGPDSFTALLRGESFKSNSQKYLLKDVELVKQISIKMMETESELFDKFMTNLVHDTKDFKDRTFFNEQQSKFYYSPKSLRKYSKLRPISFAGDSRTTIFNYISLPSYSVNQLKITKGWMKNKPKSIENPVVDTVIRQQIIGGRVEGVKGVHYAPEGSNFHMVDVVSLYPFVMNGGKDNNTYWYPVSANDKNDPDNEFALRDNKDEVTYDEKGIVNRYHVSYDEYELNKSYHDERIKSVLENPTRLTKRVAQIRVRIDQRPMFGKMMAPILPMKIVNSKGEFWDWKTFSVYEGLVPCVTIRQCIKYGCDVKILTDRKDMFDGLLESPLYIMWPAANDLFSNYINFWASIKNEQDSYKRLQSEKYNPSIRSMSKDRLNALSGKMMQRTFDNDDYLYIITCGGSARADFEKKLEQLNREYDEGVESAKKLFGQKDGVIPKHILEKLDRLRPEISPIGSGVDINNISEGTSGALYLLSHKMRTPTTPSQVGVFILANARAYMYDIFYSRMKVYYSDTDSAIINDEGYQMLMKDNLVVSKYRNKEFGKLEYEARISSFTVSMPKCYSITAVDNDGNFDPYTSKGRCKGVKLEDSKLSVEDNFYLFSYYRSYEEKENDYSCNEEMKNLYDWYIEKGCSPGYANSVLVNHILSNDGYVKTFRKNFRSIRKEGKVVSKGDIVQWLHSDYSDLPYTII